MSTYTSEETNDDPAAPLTELDEAALKLRDMTEQQPPFDVDSIGNDIPIEQQSTAKIVCLVAPVVSPRSSARHVFHQVRPGHWCSAQSIFDRAIGARPDCSSGTPA